jgi:hypothetical protein
MLAPRYPIYIPSKGRADTRFTSKTLEALELPYTIVVEPQEYDAYAAVIDARKIVTLPWRDRGLVAARNFIWEHAIERGAARHWQMDDNIRGLLRFNRNLILRVHSSGTLRAMEDFVDRYENVPMAGPNYKYFAKHRDVIPPFILNTRVYSCYLLDNRVPHRFEGFYNDDTDLALRFLKDGYCTVLFNTFLIGKAVTMTLNGGNTPHYVKKLNPDGTEFDGRLAMAQELAAKHPDVVRVSRKFGRWQHHVDYRPFKRNRLRRRTDIDPAIFEQPIDEYGMTLVTRATD